MRIEPDAVTGYIAALRETNSVGDGKDRVKQLQTWKQKVVNSAQGRTDGEVTLAPTGLNPAVGEVPADFNDIGYAALEGKLGQLVHSTDKWADLNRPEQLIPVRDRSMLAGSQTALEPWRGQAQPRIDSSIEPWVMHFMDNSPLSFSMDLLKDSLTVLPTKGSSKQSKQRLLAGEGLTYLDQVKDGHQKETHSYWGGILKRGDFTAQEMSIACFHFQVIDFGDSIPIQDSLMRSTGNGENVERNQCVLLHLAAGIMWNESGRANEYRAEVECSHWRKN